MSGRVAASSSFAESAVPLVGLMLIFVLVGILFLFVYICVAIISYCERNVTTSSDDIEIPHRDQVAREAAASRTEFVHKYLCTREVNGEDSVIELHRLLLLKRWGRVDSGNERGSNQEKIGSKTNSTNERIGDSDIVMNGRRGDGIEGELVLKESVSHGEEPPEDSQQSQNIFNGDEESPTFMSKPECAICLNLFLPKDEIAWTKIAEQCTHIFHEVCLVSWLQTRDDCPLCRRNIVGVVIEDISEEI